MKKPFIKLFHTPNSGYFYDVGKNEIVRIPEDVYQHLYRVEQGVVELEQPEGEDALEIIKSFMEMGYLSTKRPKKIQHSATSMIPLFLDRCIEKITLQLTQDCNFRCKYCIYSEDKNLKQRSHAHKSMSLETAKKAILFYRDHAVDSSMYNVGFYGGEPLLQWETVKETILFAEKELAGKLLLFTITTNASLLTEEKASFFEEHNVSLLVSLDGVKETNDENRVFPDGTGTSHVVLKNLRLLNKRYPNLFKELHISSVIDPSINVVSFGEYPDVIKQIPLDHYTVNVADNTDNDVELPEELSVELEKASFLAYLADLGLYSKEVTPYGYGRIRDMHSHQRVLKPASGMLDVIAPGGPCIPGKSRLMVSVNGDFYPCERVNETNANCIGNLKRGFDIAKAQRILNVGTISEKACQNCWALRLCTICIKHFDYSGENAQIEKLRYCESVKSSAYERIRALIMFYEFNEYYKKAKKEG